MGYQPQKYHWVAYSGFNQEEWDKGEEEFIFGIVFCQWQCYISFVFPFLRLPATGRVVASVLSRKGSCETSCKANAFQPQLALHLIHALVHILPLVSPLCLLGSNATLEQRSSVQSSFLRREWCFPPPPDREFCFLKQCMAFYMSYPFRKYYQRCWRGGAGKREREVAGESKREEREHLSTNHSWRVSWHSPFTTCTWRWCCLPRALDGHRTSSQSVCRLAFATLDRLSSYGLLMPPQDTCRNVDHLQRMPVPKYSARGEQYKK